MPNWVFNYLNLEGDEISIARAKKQLNSPYTKKYVDYGIDESGQLNPIVKTITYNNPVFSFWNIIKPEDIDSYELDSTGSFPNWYQWNLDNWSTKWDVSVLDNEEYPETELVEDNNTVLDYRFDTPWSPPINAIKTLSLQYPSLKIVLDFQEETGWGGKMQFINGVMTELSEYGWKCSECDVELQESPWCDECEYDTCPECGYGEPNIMCKKHKEQVNV